MKAFNTTGPCLPDQHYMLDPLARLPEARKLAEQGKYFVLHAPRQSGKTTVLAALARELNATGEYAALRFSAEAARVDGEDHVAAQLNLLGSLRKVARYSDLPPDCLPPDELPETPPGLILHTGLQEWAASCPRPLVLFIDEIDALAGNSLISVLTQLRDGYIDRPAPFPHSVGLCGMRDVREYKAGSSGTTSRLGTGSPFNISATSLVLGDLTFAETAELYDQHTEATGQVFEPRAVQRAFEASQGQPWLVNALARDIIEVMGVPASEPITDDLMDQAVERLIRQRATHLDSLVARLYEPRVKRLLGPMISGGDPPFGDEYHEDLLYTQDLGLLTRTLPVRVSNPIYQEVIVRVLSQGVQDSIHAQPHAFLLPDGRLDVDKLLQEFIAFWKMNGEILDSQTTYHEAACHLAFMAFLQRVVNGGGVIDREYALGRKRLDLTVRKAYTDRHGRRAIQWEAYELKVHSDGSRDPIPSGLKQLDGYLDSLGLDTGTLIIFDRRKNAPPVAERTTTEMVESPTGRKVTLLRA
ncbi:ATP-binding protein [Actinomadura rupiterrae]|uniref:ATP-binding protein n=1 Tax=Actinomadura rupiterrae TaxID=559627 RepID=UPI0020A32159|nr:ATP-binding protein [Actinomadura rupiterrae]MCP2337824.1 hypothetical protein [Actinomadura rupiterrae]